MKKTIGLAVLSATILAAQSHEITGVWKADLQKSKLGGQAGPPPTNYLVIIQRKMAIFNQRTKEQALQIIETTGIWGEHGEQRSVLTVFINNKPIVRPYRGVPTRLIAGWEGDVFKVNGEMSGHPSSFTRTYRLSPDGKTLAVDIEARNQGKQTQTHLVLLKEPEEAGAPLREHEELAGTHFKNVKTESLKKLPASEFIDQMRYFAWSLNRDCEFCHVEHKFDSDEKKEKKTARQMIDMVASIDQNHFEGHPEVRCFTCHEGHAHPLSHPQFADEAAAERAALEKAEAERAKR
jgi:hypothetical protein